MDSRGSGQISMKAYWDSSALVEATLDSTLRAMLNQEGGLTRTHALAETFSTLTGNPTLRMDHASAIAAVENLASDLEFVDLSAPEVIAVFRQAKRKGVRGGHVHD